MTLSIEDQQDAYVTASNNGMIAVDVVDAPLHTYSWDQSSSVDSVANDLYAGTHTVTVTDANGCVDQISPIGSLNLCITNLTPTCNLRRSNYRPRSHRKWRFFSIHIYMDRKWKFIGI